MEDRFSPSTYAAAKNYTDTHGSGGTAVQSDWNQTDNTADDYIKNKPTIPEAQIQSDWEQDSSSAADYIKNKPDISTKADKVSSPTSGNFAGLDSNGNLTDSGKKAADFATPSNVAGEEISGTATGTSITLTDSADGYVQGINVKGHSHKNKNLLEITATTQTKNGVTFTVNSDRTVTIHGTASGNANFQLVTYGTLSEYDGCIAVVDPTVITQGVSMNIELVNSPWTAYVKTGNLPQTINYNGNNDEKNLFLRVLDGVTADTTFKPMICTVADYERDPSYEPYVGGGIKSIGDDGFTITTTDSTETLSAATITTGLPLRSTLDGTVYDELTNEKVITRCEVVEGEVVPLATPTETPLTSAEKSALASLKTYSTTHIDATDAPTMTVDYLLNTNNGQAVAKVDNKIGEKYTTAEKTKLAGVQDNATANDVIDTSVTLTVNGWVGNDAPYTQTVNVTGVLSTDQAIVDLSVSSTVATGLDEIDDWALISKIETGAGTMTFTCYEDKPTTELTANVHIVRGTSSGAVSPVLKSVTWTGTGTTTRSITFPEKPTLILSIQFTNKDNINAGVVPFRYGVPSMFCMYGSNTSSWSGSYASVLTYSVDELTMTITGSDKGSAWNDETTDYILYYM